MVTLLKKEIIKLLINNKIMDNTFRSCFDIFLEPNSSNLDIYLFIDLESEFFNI